MLTLGIFDCAFDINAFEKTFKRQLDSAFEPRGKPENWPTTLVTPARVGHHWARERMSRKSASCRSKKEASPRMPFSVTKGHFLEAFLPSSADQTWQKSSPSRTFTRRVVGHSLTNFNNFIINLFIYSWPISWRNSECAVKVVKLKTWNLICSPLNSRFRRATRSAGSKRFQSTRHPSSFLSSLMINSNISLSFCSTHHKQDYVFCFLFG